MQSRLSQPPTAFLQEWAGDLRDSASSFPPMHLPRKQRTPVTPLGFLIRNQVWAVGATQTGAFPVCDDL